jgi:hypothetical protein
LEQQKTARRTYWGPAMTDSQYAAFHFDVKTMCVRDAEPPLIFVGRAELDERLHGRPAAQRSLLVGMACLWAGVALISLDVWFGLRLIIAGGRSQVNGWSHGLGAE